MKKIFVIPFVLVLLSAFASPVLALSPSIDFYYSETCPHCLAELKFLDDLETEYEGIEINRYVASDEESRNVLAQRLSTLGADQYLGVVPITFVGDDLFIGFDNERGIGADIEDSYRRQSGIETNNDEKTNAVNLPGIANWDLEGYSLPALAVILGTLDGFNVCSLGALVFILGLVLTLRSRRKIVLYGGLFVLTTGLIYGSLIFLWSELFSTLAGYVWLMHLLVALIGIAGGIYFFKEYLKMRKHGVTCDSSGMPIVGKLSTFIEKLFEDKKGLIWLVGAVLGFATAITIIEFPCSAAVPVFFASLLASAGLESAAYVGHISLFTLFYLLDEFIVFGIAVWRMNIWLTSPKFVKGITLTEGLVLFGIGAFYLIKLIL